MTANGSTEPSRPRDIAGLSDFPSVPRFSLDQRAGDFLLSEFVQQYADLFVGRRDVYAEGKPDPDNPTKNRYYARHEELTDAALLQHLKGQASLGVYQLSDDSTVRWFCLDFDAPKDELGFVVADPFPIALAEARTQQVKFEQAGLFTYVERSRSGNGVHVWGFLDRPTDAGIVRRALRPLLTKGESWDRLYPLQDAVTASKPYGNLIALPFHGEAFKRGCSTFIDDTNTPIPPREWITGVLRNSADVLALLAEKAPKIAPRGGGSTNAAYQVGAELPGEGGTIGALKVLSEFGCRFFRHCYTDRRRLAEPQWYAGIQIATHFEHGRNLAHLLSEDHPGYSEAATDAKYDQALENPRIGCQWIHDNYPELACQNCPSRNNTMLAPHHVAKRSLADLHTESRTPMEVVGTFDDDLDRIGRLDSGEEESGILWRFDGLDEVTRFRNKEVTVVGGFSSLGKTALMMDGAWRLGNAGVPVFIFSAETGRSALRTRLLGRAAEVDTRALRGERREKLTSGEWDRLKTASQKLKALPIYMDFSSLTADDVIEQVEDALLRNRVPLDTPYVVWFDFLQFGATMSAEEQSEYTRLSRISSDFKLVAKTLDRPLLVFSQLKREKEGNETPEINWFKGTGRIETDMDVGIIITGERVEGACAPRRMTVVKQREAVANVALDFVLQQSFGRWDYVGRGESEVQREPLFAEQPNPMEL